MLRLVYFKNVELWRALVAEYMATLFLVFLACGSALPFSRDLDIVKISLAFGLSIAAMVQIFGRVSGGHINPAVTVAMVVTRKIDLTKAALYIILQCLGAISGSALLLAVTAAPARGTLGANDLLNGTGIAQAVAVEFFLTMLLVFVVFAAIDERNKAKNMAPLTIGLAVTCAHLFGIPYTGVSINPARSLGPAVMAHHWSHHWVFWVGPLLGGVAAGGIYHYILSPPAEDDEEKVAYAGAPNSGMQPMHLQSRKNSVFTLGELRSMDTTDLEAVATVYVNNAHDAVQVASPKATSKEAV